MKPGIALLLALFIACPPNHAAEPQQNLQAKSKDPTGALDNPDVTQRIQRLRQLVRETREAAARAVDSYCPTMKDSLDDLGTPVPDLLCRLPEIAKVSIHKPVDRPTHRIVHLTDWHFLPKDLFAADNPVVSPSTPAASHSPRNAVRPQKVFWVAQPPISASGPRGRGVGGAGGGVWRATRYRLQRAVILRHIGVHIDFSFRTPLFIE